MECCACGVSLLEIKIKSEGDWYCKDCFFTKKELEKAKGELKILKKKPFGANASWQRD